MPRDGPKAVLEVKGPVSQEETKVADMRAIMEILHKMNSHLDKIDSRFDKMDEQGEKTGERKEGAVVNGGHGDTPFNRGSESPLCKCSRKAVVFEQRGARPSCSVKVRHVKTPSNRGFEKGCDLFCELHTSDMQSVAARTVFQMVPLAESNTAVAVPCLSSGEKPGDMSNFK